MIIPGFGTLDHDQLQDSEICLKLLMGSKHQLLEGLIVENLFDQWMASQTRFNGQALKEVSQTTLICQRYVSGNSRDPCAFVLADHDDSDVFRFESSLNTEMTVIPVRYDENQCEFQTVLEWRDSLNDRNHCDHPLAKRLSSWLSTYPRTTSVHPSVRDVDRQKGSFWGFLSGAYGSQLASKVVIPRLFKDFGPQPFFSSGWDVDRVILDGDDLWSIEIKHKYPFGGRELKFGLNVGELKAINWLERSGIRSLHMIVVKPVWSKDQSPHYIFNDVNLRNRALVLGLVFDKTMIDRIQSGLVGTSAAHTTFSGSGQLSYLPIPAAAFKRLGLVSDPPEKVMSSIRKLLRGEEMPAIDVAELREMRVDRIG